MKGKNNIAIITSGYFPVPATLGGAVEALDENLIKQNEINKKIKFTDNITSANFIFICMSVYPFKQHR